MDFRLIKEEAKTALIGNRLMLLVALIIVSAIVGVTAYIFGLGFLISPVLGAGTYLVCKKLFEDGNINFNDLFHFFKDLNHAVKLFAVSFVYGLIVMLGFILFIIPGIIFSFQYSQALYIMADDPNCGIWEAMQKSKQLMVGYKWDFFVFQLSFIGHIILSAITFGLYGLYFMPYYQQAMVNYYLHLSGQKDKKQEPLLDENF